MFTLINKFNDLFEVNIVARKIAFKITFAKLYRIERFRVNENIFPSNFYILSLCEN